jgi:hypothetical protein
MKYVLKVLNKYIESNVNELKRKDAKIKELWNDNGNLRNEVKALRKDLQELSKEYFKK